MNHEENRHTFAGAPPETVMTGSFNKQYPI
jgi:hypothetical protein